MYAVIRIEPGVAICFMRAAKLVVRNRTATQGKEKEAYLLLNKGYRWFTEGFDTKDLQEAKTMLEELT